MEALFRDYGTVPSIIVIGFIALLVYSIVAGGKKGGGNGNSGGSNSSTNNTPPAPPTSPTPPTPPTA